MNNKSSKIPINQAFQTRDAGRLFSLQKNIARRQKNRQATDQLEQKLAHLIKQSAAKCASIRSQLPNFKFDHDLPIVEKKETIAELLENNQVLIVAGETGCGKTTQLPKICLQAGFGVRGKIAHTQPRRVAATSVAARIASEVATPLGDTVGYSVRFNDKTSAKTRIKLMTDGILLSEFQSDPMLSEYEVIIIDEAHERSLNIDFLLGFLKQLLRKRSDLKVIVTSATIDPQSFSTYFDNAPIVLVEGRTFPVSVIYQPIEALENLSSVDPILNGVQHAIDSCVAESTGDILIFSHGEGEIKSITNYLRKSLMSEMQILPLYARLSIKEQQAIFKPSNKRKIVIATNVAETSLTIPNIVFVIDIGTARISRYSQRNKIQQLPIEKISKASAEQRKGRCGRICPGICIRLYSNDDYDNRDEFTLAEIKRTNLASVVLRLKNMQVKDVEEFPFIEMPEAKQWKNAFNLLFELKATDSQNQITTVGKRMAGLPIDPQLARILLNEKSQAINEMLIVTSFLSVRDVRMRPQEQTQKADACHSQFRDSQSDILTIIKLWQELLQAKSERSSNQFRKWCVENYLNFVTWLEWRNVFRQLKENVESLGVQLNSQPASADQVHQSLVCGFISHLLLKTQEKHFQGARGLKVWIHPSSVLFKNSPSWMLATELVETGKLFARNVIPIKVEWVEQIASHLTKTNYQDIHWRKKKGQAACFFNQTIFGLPLVNRRLIDYSQIDRPVARQLFLQEGLASDCCAMEFPFLSSNRKTLIRLEEEESKRRVNDIRIDRDVLATLYAEKIPDSIVTINALNKWLKKDWKKRNGELSFTQQLLSQCSIDETEQYPNFILVRGVELQLTYSFAPGEKQDGVCVVVPEEMLDQFNQSDFEWLVPGLLEDKLLAVLKKLDKPNRKLLIPLSASAKSLAESISLLDYPNLPFKKTVASTLNRLHDLRLSESDISVDELPLHLTMKFSTSKIPGKKKSRTMFAKLNDLLNHSSLQDKQGQQKKNQSSLSNHFIQNSSQKLYTWPNEEIELEVINKTQGKTIRQIVGLKDKKTHVELLRFSSLLSAKESHRRGVARLITLDHLKLVKEIQNGWPDRNKLEYLNLRFGGFKTLVEWFSFMAALIEIKQFENSQLANGHVANIEHYQSISRVFGQTARAFISKSLTQVVSLLQTINDIYASLSNLESETYIESVDDIRQQIDSLWSREQILETGDQLLLDYTRYFSAIKSRIKRINENYPKEQLAVEQWIEWYDWWQDIESEIDKKPNQKGELKAEYDALYWMLQEYRISLFSTNVKTRGKISAKRLQKAFEKMEQSIARLV